MSDAPDLESLADDVEELRHQAVGARKIAQNALGKLQEEREAWEEERAAYEERIERLEYRIGELEAAVDPDPTQKEYDDLAKAERVRLVREELVKRAEASSAGKAKLDYQGVVWGVFDGEPSPGYAYKLMKEAAREDGFEYVSRSNGDNSHLRVNSAAVKDETLFHAVNKDGEGASV